MNQEERDKLPDFSDTKHDGTFKEMKSMKWLPWVGRSYERTRTIIVGESHYEDGDDWQENNPEATRIVISKQFTDQRGKTYSYAEKALLGKDQTTAADGLRVWPAVASMNVVQRLMSSIQERPNDEDFDQGWISVLGVAEYLKASTCVVLGKSGLGRLGYLLANHDTGWERIRFDLTERIVIIRKDDQQLTFTFINHPSAPVAFDRERWTNLIRKNAPELEF